MLDLTTRGATKTNDPAAVASVDERDVVENVGARRERDYPQLIILEAIVDPDKGSIPVQFPRDRQRDAMSRLVYRVFLWIEVDSHALL